MNRYVLVISAAFTSLVAFFSFAQSDDRKPPEKMALNKENEERLLVTIWPRITRVQIEEPFEVSLRVVNATERLQSFRVMASTWEDHWKPNNPRIVWAGHLAITNPSIIIKLEPGQAYEKTLEMLVNEGPPLVVTSFQLGFTPIDEKKTYWSNKITLGIKPGKRK